MPAPKRSKAIAKYFGMELRQARNDAGLTQQTLAERAEIEPVFVSFLENGHRQPSLTVLLAIERALGLGAGVLARRVGKRLVPKHAEKTRSSNLRPGSKKAQRT